MHFYLYRYRIKKSNYKVKGFSYKHSRRPHYSQHPDLDIYSYSPDDYPGYGTEISSRKFQL